MKLINEFCKSDEFNLKLEEVEIFYFGFEFIQLDTNKFVHDVLIKFLDQYEFNEIEYDNDA